MLRSTLSKLLPLRSLSVLCLLAAGGVGAACSSPVGDETFPEAIDDAGSGFSPRFELERRSVTAEREAMRLSGVLPVVEGRWVVLGHAEPKSSVGKIHMETDRGADVVVTSRAAAASTVQTRVPGIHEAELSLAGVPRGCAGRLGEVRVLNRMGSAYLSYDPETAKLSDADFAKTAWEQSEGFGLLVAELVTSPECRSATYVTLVGTEAPEVLERYQPAPDSAQSYRLAQQAFVGVKALKPYQTTRDFYHQFLGDSNASLPEGVESEWETYAGAQPELVFYGNDERQLVGWTLRAGEGCGDFQGNLSVLYEVVQGTDGARLRLVEINEASPLPDRIVSYGDRLELWDIDGVRAPNDEIPRIPLHIPSFECPC